MTIGSENGSGRTCACCARFNICRRALKSPLSPVCGDHHVAVCSFTAAPPLDVFQALGLAASAAKKLAAAGGGREEAWQYLAGVFANAGRASVMLAATPFQVFNTYAVCYRGSDVAYLSNWAEMLLVGVQQVASTRNNPGGYALDFVSLSNAPQVRGVTMLWETYEDDGLHYHVRFPVAQSRILDVDVYTPWAEKLLAAGRIVDPELEANRQAHARKRKSSQLAQADGGKDVPDTVTRLGTFDADTARDWPASSEEPVWDILADEVSEVPIKDISQFPYVDTPEDEALVALLLGVFPQEFFVGAGGGKMSPVKNREGIMIDTDAAAIYLAPLADLVLDTEHGVVLGGNWESARYRGEQYLFQSMFITDVAKARDLVVLHDPDLPPELRDVLYALLAATEVAYE